MRYYARWTPTKRKRWATCSTGDERLAVNERDVRGFWNQKVEPRGMMESAEVSEMVGSPGWTRTSDILINSRSGKRNQKQSKAPGK
jgi:hypothetical protein